MHLFEKKNNGILLRIHLLTVHRHLFENLDCSSNMMLAS